MPSRAGWAAREPVPTRGLPYGHAAKRPLAARMDSLARAFSAADRLPLTLRISNAQRIRLCLKTLAQQT